MMWRRDPTVAVDIKGYPWLRLLPMKEAEMTGEEMRMQAVDEKGYAAVHDAVRLAQERGGLLRQVIVDRSGGDTRAAGDWHRYSEYGPPGGVAEWCYTVALGGGFGAFVFRGTFEEACAALGDRMLLSWRDVPGGALGRVDDLTTGELTGIADGVSWTAVPSGAASPKAAARVPVWLPYEFAGVVHRPECARVRGSRYVCDCGALAARLDDLGWSGMDPDCADAEDQKRLEAWVAVRRPLPADDPTLRAGSSPSEGAVWEKSIAEFQEAEARRAAASAALDRLDAGAATAPKAPDAPLSMLADSEALLAECLELTGRIVSWTAAMDGCGTGSGEVSRQEGRAGRLWLNLVALRGRLRDVADRLDRL